MDYHIRTNGEILASKKVACIPRVREKNLEEGEGSRLGLVKETRAEGLEGAL